MEMRNLIIEDLQLMELRLLKESLLPLHGFLEPMLTCASTAPSLLQAPSLFPSSDVISDPPLCPMAR